MLHQLQMKCQQLEAHQSTLLQSSNITTQGELEAARDEIEELTKKVNGWQEWFEHHGATWASAGQYMREQQTWAEKY